MVKVLEVCYLISTRRLSTSRKQCIRHFILTKLFCTILRYTLDVDLKTVVTPEKLESTASRVEARKVSTAYIASPSGLYLNW